MDNFNINNNDNIIKLLTSIIDRMDRIILCLPDMLQINMEDAKNNVSCFLNKLNCERNDFYVEKFEFFDNLSLYMQLNTISSYLGICMLLCTCNTLLEDAYYNIEFIMRKMDSYDSSFKFCYEKENRRILK